MQQCKPNKISTLYRTFLESNMLQFIKNISQLFSFRLNAIEEIFKYKLTCKFAISTISKPLWIWDWQFFMK